MLIIKRMVLILFLFTGIYSYAQQKFALVIGNGDYTGISKLQNPVNDANDMAAVLKDLGFTVEMVINGDLDQMETAAINLSRRLSASRDIYGFFFYAGHGVQSGGDNYLIPVDANNIQSENHLRQRAFSVQTLLDNLNDSRNELNIIVLDACRDNPFGWARSGGRGLARLSSTPAGSIIMFATSTNSSAEDGSGRNGLFTGQFLNNLKTPGLSLRDIFDKTGEDVLRVSNGRQHPELSIRYFAASNTFLGLAPVVPATVVQSASPPQPGQIPGLALMPSDFFGAWIYEKTVIVFSSGGFSVSWPESDGSTVGYTVSALTYAAVTNTTGRNPNFQYGYKIIGRVTSSTVPSIAAGTDVERSYFFDINKQSFWNSGSSTYVIYHKQLKY